jgi:hypothetical protein
MMKKNNQLIATAILLLTMLGACKKKDDPIITQKKEETPTIVINEPKADHYDVGETVTIQVVVTDTEEMHEVKGWLIAVPQNDTLWYKRVHSHDKVVTLEDSYVVSQMPEKQQVELRIYVENDNNKSATATHVFEVHGH